MEIELDRSQQLDVAKWEGWFEERPPPPSMFGVKFYTKEEVHVKVITDNAVFTRTAGDGMMFSCWSLRTIPSIQRETTSWA